MKAEMIARKKETDSKNKNEIIEIEKQFMSEK